MAETEEVQVRRLDKGDVLEDGRVVKAYAFGPSTHDPAFRVWFEDDTHETFYDSYEVVRRVVRSEKELR